MLPLAWLLCPAQQILKTSQIQEENAKNQQAVPERAAQVSSLPSTRSWVEAEDIGVNSQWAPCSLGLL